MLKSNRSKSGKKAKRKGSKFERDVCKLLEVWTGYRFRRVPLSGGWQKSKLTGDVVCIDSDDFEYSVEAKKQEGWDLSNLFSPVDSRGKTKILHWWEQCLNDAVQLKKLPLLIFSKNYYSVVGMCYYRDISDWAVPHNYFKFYSRDFDDTMIIFDFEDFVNVNKVEV